MGKLPAGAIGAMGLAFTPGTIATPEKLVRLYGDEGHAHYPTRHSLRHPRATGLNLVILVIALTSIVIFPRFRAATSRCRWSTRAVRRTVPRKPAAQSHERRLGSDRGRHHVHGGLAHRSSGSALAHDIYGTLRPVTRAVNEDASLDRARRDSDRWLDTAPAHPERRW